MDALALKGLQKRYKNGVIALKGIDLHVAEGDFFGLLGPNGAGKTTIIGIVTGLVNKTKGTAAIFGRDIDREFHEARRLIGVVPQEMNFNIFDKVQDVVVNQGGYYGLPRRLAMQRAEQYLRQLGLWEKRKDQSRTLSGGMKRRLMIARALVHEPKLLILDEPTAGVDVELRRSMWDFLRGINARGVTIILTTHYLEEAEQLCRNIAIIHKGAIVENTSTKALLRKQRTETFVFDLKTPLAHIDSPNGLRCTLVDPTTLEVQVTRQQSLNEVFAHLQRQGIEVLSMRAKANRLEELYLGLTEARA